MYYLGCLGDFFWQALCQFVQVWGLFFLEFPSPCLKKKKNLSNIVQGRRGRLSFQYEGQTQDLSIPREPLVSELRPLPHFGDLKIFSFFFSFVSLSLRDTRKTARYDTQSNHDDNDKDNYRGYSLLLVLSVTKPSILHVSSIVNRNGQS